MLFGKTLVRPADAGRIGRVINTNDSVRIHECEEIGPGGGRHANEWLPNMCQFRHAGGSRNSSRKHAEADAQVTGLQSHLGRRLPNWWLMNDVENPLLAPALPARSTESRERPPPNKTNTRRAAIASCSGKRRPKSGLIFPQRPPPTLTKEGTAYPMNRCVDYVFESGSAK